MTLSPTSKMEFFTCSKKIFTRDLGKTKQKKHSLNNDTKKPVYKLDYYFFTTNPFSLGVNLHT